MPRPELTRRRALLATGALIAGGLGASQYARRETVPTIHLQNFHEEPKDVEVLLLRGDEVSHWEVVSLPGNEDDETPPPTRFLDDLPEESAAYTLYAYEEDPDDRLTHSLDGVECLEISVLSGGPLDFWAREPERCRRVRAATASKR
ncbi:hypothetical protein [Haloarcula nitratireducens]|uniref:Uncharacterized protein n=1 Tax=Haloarcula nitratireducens TaxID=2487749 RepID=A0AAW4PEQ2_9EURY|nr:hypothetical protein [Halomicroarcula nitratireducens]MBX0296445.1 hypothetical protein [Halomicroarcula nitratireducens]